MHDYINRLKSTILGTFSLLRKRLLGMLHTNKISKTIETNSLAASLYVTFFGF